MKYPDLSHVLGSIEDHRLRMSFINEAIAFRERQSWIEKIQEAMYSPKTATGLITLHRERIVPLTHAERTERYEVLARLQPKDGSDLILPGQFLGHVATDPEFSRQFDRYIISMALARASVGAQTIAINLSATSVEDETLSLFVQQRLNCCHNPDIRIIFEITEHQRFEIPVAQKVLRQLKRWGCEVAIDDFAQGHSGFHQLTLPVDWIKLDGSIVECIADPVHQAIARDIMEIAQRRELGVVAEWIETPTQENIIRNLALEVGIKAWGQGRLYDPMPESRAA
jgi:EAL domain-containing protein (putative c-di-GMP-specific phosphodiesterase class I)